MKRIIVVCEGQTEQAFCNTLLQPHFLSRGIYLTSPIIKHTKGGIVKWLHLKKQIETHLYESPTVIVTTFIDYYGIYAKHSFPNWDSLNAIQDPNKRMVAIEEGMRADIAEKSRYRFLPYMQLHEFEALLFNELNIFHEQIPPHDLVKPADLEQIFLNYPNPELINGGYLTAPSKRLTKIISGYNKVVYGDILAEAIGLIRIRQKCPRFHAWLQKLEAV